jgi:hypothetical protein
LIFRPSIWPLAREQGRTVTPADVEAERQAKRATDDAMDALHKTAPVTMAGLKAVIAYCIEWDEGWKMTPSRASHSKLAQY